MNNKKKIKELSRRYGKLAESMEEYYHHLDFRPLDDLNDDGFAFLIDNVRGVNMLDLDETEIGNESINKITHLEYVKELRLKGCRNIDDDCISDINKLSSLELLHVKGTKITIEGLLQLRNLKNLSTLLFSADETEDLSNKIATLQNQMPNCKLIVNGTPVN